ncbi:MAG: hypothetical protein Q7T82_21115 [Armatimonadota bacterium]|nr:hypothetical protein [Armatimonadota bacterium]
MSMQDDPLQEAQVNTQRTAVNIEQAIASDDNEEMLSHVQEAIRYGEQARSFLEEALDSTDDERLVMHGEQALESIEDILDQANQALFASEASTREHVDLMSSFCEQAVTHLEMALGMEVP